MPIYGFRCTSDEHHTEEHYYPYRETDFSRACEKCGGPMARDLRVEARNHIPSSAFPYVTTHVTGKPLEIRSLEHLREVERQYNVRNRDDADYVEEQWGGFDLRDGQHKYSGRSGGGGHSTRWV